MRSKERLLTVLNDELPDRVPVSLFVQEEYLSWFYPRRKQVNRISDALDCALHYGFDLLSRDNFFTRPWWLKESREGWELSEHSWVENGIYYLRTSIMTPDGELSMRESGPYDVRTIRGIHLHTDEYLIEEQRDLEILISNFPTESDRSHQQRAQRFAQTDHILGDHALACPWGAGGVFNSVSTYRNIEKLLTDPYLDPEFYQLLMEFFTSWIVKDYHHLLEAGYQALGIQGNIANGSLVSGDYFDSFILPYEQSVAQAITEGGGRSIYHNCGAAKGLYESYTRLGIDLWETVAPPPMGDNDLLEAKSYFKGRMALSGNIDQVDFLKRATVKEVREKTEELMSIGSPGGGFIFAASDYLEPDTPEENIHMLVDTAIACGCY